MRALSLCHDATKKLDDMLEAAKISDTNTVVDEVLAIVEIDLLGMWHDIVEGSWIQVDEDIVSTGLPANVSNNLPIPNKW